VIGFYLRLTLSNLQSSPGGRRKAHIDFGEFNPGEEPLCSGKGAYSFGEWVQMWKMGSIGGTEDGWADKNRNGGMRGARACEAAGSCEGKASRKLW
jgi:hypothetical protein